MAAEILRPHFDQLPARKGDPPFSAWGIWGPNDKVGTLNLLTKDAIRHASHEIKTGQRFSLNWSLNSPKTPGFGRSMYSFSHTIHHDNPHLLVLEDCITFNTQRSSQWDGLRHFAYQREQLFYNGTTKDEIFGKNSSTLGLQNWNEVGGIAGRGLLVDYWRYAQQKGLKYDPLTSDAISFDSLMACLKEQGDATGSTIEILPGDILLVRCGYMARYQQLDEIEEARIGKLMPPQTSGVAQERSLLKWLWENRIAAVGGDAPAFECFPPVAGAEFMFHEVLLAGWGCPIGELFWLEDLAQECAEQKKWTFFLSSSPLNVDGGVASPANVMAVM